MRPRAEYERIRALISAGVNDCAVARATGVPRGTVKDWRNRTVPPGVWPARGPNDLNCPICTGTTVVDEATYAYLLGLYLGDGCISRSRRGVYFLRVSLDARYPGIIDDCHAAMATISRRRVHRVPAPGCVVVQAHWNHWPCLFPQHGTGKKHLRPIRLAEWQSAIVRRQCRRLLRGLLHSDGSRSANTVNGTVYPRYEFTNFSTDILAMFCWACDLLGVRWTQPWPTRISVARRPDVRAMDEFVGPKQ